MVDLGLTLGAEIIELSASCGIVSQLQCTLGLVATDLPCGRVVWIPAS